MNHSALIPPGWNHNPSAWPRRWPLFGLALTGLAIALYLALYQWGLLATVWEPFFGDGSRKVLHSGLSRVLPVPDAAFGALAYLAEAFAELLGGPERWRQAPWSVFAFGAIASLMALGSVGLVIWQGVVIGAWCTLCLGSAAISLLIFGLAASEWRAAWQWVRFEERRGFSFWDAVRGKEYEA